MVALATATLAITGQVAPWALAIAGASLLAATALRERHRAWQRSPLLLNGALAACVAAGAVLFVRGELAVIALAHFAVLAQALQLLDARPRRSEFLLVALSLFQVVLAANLTDSAFFPILLVAFTVATVWTLLVHTLRAEALEAGRPEAAGQALSGGLRRTVTLASLASVGLALVFFPMLPRLRSGVLLAAGAGGAVAVSGFSERVELGDLGRIRLDPRVVLRVETLDGEAPGPAARYVRGLAFDHFDGRRWSVTPPGRERVPGDPEIGVDLGGPRRGARLHQRIAREALDSGILFSTGTPSGLRGAVGRLERDAGGALYAHQSAGRRVDYTLATRVSSPDPEALALDRAAAPEGARERLLELPELSPAVASLAREITRDAPHDAARLAALEAFLRREGRYTDTPPTLDRDDPRSPVEVFLSGERAGHCEYFATAMAVLARSLGIPARLVNGFAGGRANRLGGFVEYAQSDAHTWVEVPFEGGGWVRYDPTPPDLRMAGAEALRAGAGGLTELASALELWWFRNVVDFDRGHQARALHSLWRKWRGWRGHARSGAQPDAVPGAGAKPGPLPWRWILVAAALVGTGLALARRLGPAERDPLPSWYADALRVLARRGLSRGPATPARVFAETAARELPPRGAEAFRALTEAYLRARFAGESVAAPRHELAVLRDSLRS